MDKVCDGCRGSITSDRTICYARRDFKNNDNCPCRNCIVKVLCKETCQDRFDYYLRKKKKVILNDKCM